MSSNNGTGVIRIGRKGLKKFAFGDNDPFEVDVVVAFQRWLVIDDGFRPATSEDKRIPVAEVPTYHAAAQGFIAELGGGEVTTAEALDFLARLREEYDALADFFRPRSREERASPDTSEAGLHFSEEPAS